ncbi:MAG TPA: hypothetical protein ENN22_00105 [bacterium]|nr:hypothetical protein [bacterium]
MKQCPFQDRVIDYFFGELSFSEKSEYNTHLSQCPVCAENLKAIKLISPKIKSRQREQPDPEMLRRYEHALKQSWPVSSQQPSIWKRLLQNFVFKPSLTIRLAEGVALIIIGFFIGRLAVWQPSINNQLEKEVELSMIHANEQLMENFMQEAEILLLDVANLNPDEDEQILSKLKQLATYRNLKHKTMLCRHRAEQLGDDKLISLLDELEPILLEFCNLEDEMLPEKLSEIQFMIRESQLLNEIKYFNQQKI